jgi:uncharacterized protein (TIGR03382 family)
VSAARVAALLAAALAAVPAAAYVRTRGTGGAELAWREPVVAWHLNRAAFDPVPPGTAPISPSCRAGAGGDPGLEAVRASFEAWEQPCADLRLVYAGTVPDIRVGTVGSRENVVVFREGWCSARPEVVADPCYDDPGVDCGGIYNCFEDHAPSDKAVVALTSVLYDPATGRILGADIEVNGWDGVTGPLAQNAPVHGWYFTCHDPANPPVTCTTYGADGCDFIDLRNTLTHEVGHFVGLAHPCGAGTLPSCSSAVPQGAVPYVDRTMSPTTSVGDVAKRSLSADDVAGVCAIYPGGGGCGCGSGGAGGTLALLLAALALRRRRSRQGDG